MATSDGDSDRKLAAHACGWANLDDPAPPLVQYRVPNDRSLISAAAATTVKQPPDRPISGVSGGEKCLTRWPTTPASTSTPRGTRRARDFHLDGVSRVKCFHRCDVLEKKRFSSTYQPVTLGIENWAWRRLLGCREPRDRKRERRYLIFCCFLYSGSARLLAHTFSDLRPCGMPGHTTQRPRTPRTRTRQVGPATIVQGAMPEAGSSPPPPIASVSNRSLGGKTRVLVDPPFLTGVLASLAGRPEAETTD